MSDRSQALLMISPQQAAEMLSVDRDTIHKWIKSGRIGGAAKLSPRIVRIPLASVEALLERTKL